MKDCCVGGCSGPAAPNQIYFQFPSSRLLRKRWLDAINSTSVDEQASVCVRHFTNDDYEVVRGEARLRSRSVPSRRLRESDDEDSESDSEDSDSTESTSSDESEKKTKKTKDNVKDNRIDNDNENNKKTINDNVDNKKIISNTGDNREIIKDSTDNEKQKDTDEKGDENKCDTQTQDGPTENANEKCGRLNNEVNGINHKVNADNVKDDHLNSDNVKDDHLSADNVKEDHLNADNVKDDHLNADNVKDDHLNADNVKDDHVNDKIKKGPTKKTRCKITALRAINGRRKFSFSSDSTNSDSVSSSPHPSELEGHREDIEESLQHYYIENKKTERQVAAMADVINEKQKLAQKSAEEGAESVYIEFSVGQGSSAEGQEPTDDCLMLLENVQCDVDPALLLAAREEEEENMEQVDLADDDDDDDVPQAVENKNEDPISLLTSSDEDDVILQEPKYDLVEVSSADTSEDDMPLVKLVKPSSKTSSQPDAKKAKYSAKYTKNLITKLLWGRNDFYCVQCGFTTMNATEYNRHMATHSVLPSQKIIQYCQDCGFTTSSKHQMQKHKQKHKNEKRFKCQKCNYSAKHNMSLVYHMKTHISSGLNEVELAICGTYEPEKRKKSRNRKVSDADKKYKCGTCGYKTNRRSDLRRHRRRIHDGDDDDDEEYVP